MIAHTADDSLSIYTGLYGDRHGQPLSNSYKGYNPDGTTDPADVVRVLDQPVRRHRGHARPRATTARRRMVYSDTVPGEWSAEPPDARLPGSRSPAPVATSVTSPPPTWSSRTPRSTCRRSSAPARPRCSSSTPTPITFKDAEIADYIGEAVHCAHGSAIVRGRVGGEVRPDRRRPRRPSPTRCPPSPAATAASRRSSAPGTSAPQLGAGTPNLTSHGYPVTNAAGNLVDLDGNDAPGALQPSAGLPRLQPHRVAVSGDAGRHAGDRRSRSPTATSPTCTSGRPSTSDRAPRPPPPRPAGRSAPATSATTTTARPTTLRSRSSSSVSPQDGINASNTLFVISAEENDQFDGANVGRALTPTPAGCDGDGGQLLQLPGRHARRAPGQHQGPPVDHCERRYGVRRRAAGCVDLRPRAAGTRRPDAAPAGARHRRDDGQQPVQRGDRASRS